MRGQGATEGTRRRPVSSWERHRDAWEAQGDVVLWEVCTRWAGQALLLGQLRPRRTARVLLATPPPRAWQPDHANVPLAWAAWGVPVTRGRPLAETSLVPGQSEQMPLLGRSATLFRPRTWTPWLSSGAGEQTFPLPVLGRVSAARDQSGDAALAPVSAASARLLAPFLRFGFHA